MTEIVLQGRVTADLAGVEQIKTILRTPLAGRRGRAAIDLLRASVARDFKDHGWHTPDGGLLRWKESLPFGNKPEGEPLGGARGFLARAWAGGSNGFQVQTPQRVAIGVIHPAAAMHRGGSGTDARERVTVIRAEKEGARGLPAMFWYLGMRFGAWISVRKLRRGLEVPSRPHATANPRLVTDLVRMFQQALLSRSAA